MNIYEQDLGKTAANHVPLSPTSFVERSAEVFGDLEAVVHGSRRYSWRQTRDRAARLANALRGLGVGRGTTVSAMLHNTPEMVEVHYAVPALNAVLNTINTRLDAALIAWQLNHCESAVLLIDRELAPTVAAALKILREQHGRAPVVIDVCDSEYRGPGGPPQPPRDYLFTYQHAHRFWLGANDFGDGNPWGKASGPHLHRFSGGEWVSAGTNDNDPNEIGLSAPHYH